MPVSQAFLVTKATQTVTFPQISDQLPTAPPIFLSAFASSGLSIFYTVLSGPAILQGNMLTLTGAEGTVTVLASQFGNSTYYPASATISFEVARLSQTISFSSIPDQLTTSPAFNLNASASSGLSVNFLIVSGPAIVNGNQITLLGNPGLVTVLAYQSGNADYQAATSVTRTFSVNQVAQTITFSVHSKPVRK